MCLGRSVEGTRVADEGECRHFLSRTHRPKNGRCGRFLSKTCGLLGVQTVIGRRQRLGSKVVEALLAAAEPEKRDGPRK